MRHKVERMKFNRMVPGQRSDAILITAEDEEEQAMLNVAVAALELIYPKAEDFQRPTPELLLLETLKIIGARRGRERNPIDAVQERPATAPR